MYSNIYRIYVIYSPYMNTYTLHTHICGHIYISYLSYERNMNCTYTVNIQKNFKKSQKSNFQVRQKKIPTSHILVIYDKYECICIVVYTIYIPYIYTYKGIFDTFVDM